ncbi:MAG: hypothetical protein H0T47_05550 [Planctomycetaceae bacterium]|nr:hypothetical protein [Planctomycetaceae bacterium]
MLLIALIPLLLIVAGIGVWLLISRPPAQPGVDEGRVVADAFLASIRDGRPDDAWQSTTAEFKSAEGREVFRKRVAKMPVLKSPLEFVSMQTVEVGDQSRGEFLYRSSQGETAGKTVRLLVGNEYGAWKVDRLTTE